MIVVISGTWCANGNLYGMQSEGVWTLNRRTPARMRVCVYSQIVSACPLQVIALDEYEYVFSMNSQQPFGGVQIQKALSSTFDHKSFRN